LKAERLTRVVRFRGRDLQTVGGNAEFRAGQIDEVAVASPDIEQPRRARVPLQLAQDVAQPESPLALDLGLRLEGHRVVGGLLVLLMRELEVSHDAATRRARVDIHAALGKGEAWR